MSKKSLVVYRERLGSFEEVGKIEPVSDGLTFAYSESYLNGPAPHAISHSLPLVARLFSSEEARPFFEGILPEGSMRRSLNTMFHASSADTCSLIERLNNESAGALVFKTDGERPEEGRGYCPLEWDMFERFARSPQEIAPQAIERSRLSLAGAQMKMGLFRDKGSGAWFFPQGVAPSSHIVKACDGSFPGQTINEAICMETARKLDYEVAPCELIAVEKCEPLIAVERFDRVDTGNDYLCRLHQEDFLQALPYLRDKYEPTDGNYANHCASLINDESTNPFGDKQLFVLRLMFDWAVGNADNHLKNHSLLWSADWGKKELSPLYDVTCTTIYPGIYKEMGVSFGGSRRIDEVTRTEILSMARRCGANVKLVESELDELLETFPRALRSAVEGICNLGFFQAEELGRQIEAGFMERRAKIES